MDGLAWDAVFLWQVQALVLEAYQVSIPIFIPTRGRVDRQITWDRLPDALKKQTRLVCPEDELTVHSGQGRAAMSCNADGISATLQWIQDYACKHGLSKIVCLHDDIYVCKRVLNPKASDRRKDYFRMPVAKPAEVVEFFGLVDSLLDKYYSVGLSNRNASQDYAPDVEEANRQVIFHGTRPLEFRRLGVRYDAVRHMEDFHTTLSLLEMGYPNVIINSYAYTELGRPGAPGGCMIYRNAEFMTRGAELLQKLHPKFVKLRRCPPRWGIQEETLDVTVDWKRAFESGKMKQRQKLF